MGAKSQRTLERAYARGYKENDGYLDLNGGYLKDGKAFRRYIAGSYKAFKEKYGRWNEGRDIVRGRAKLIGILDERM